MGQAWRVEISGNVTTLTEDLARVTVPRGTYTMRPMPIRMFELERRGGPSFLLTQPELTAYINERSLTIASGQWP